MPLDEFPKRILQVIGSPTSPESVLAGGSVLRRHAHGSLATRPTPSIGNTRATIRPAPSSTHGTLRHGPAPDCLRDAGAYEGAYVSPWAIAARWRGSRR